MGVKKNFVYSAVLTCSGYVFVFITYPYVSRVLGVENIGICNFVSSIVQYFLLFSTMGIMAVGTREVAKCNGNRERLSHCFSSLVTINLIFTVIVAIVYLLCIFLIPKLFEYRRLLYVGLLQIVMTPFLIEWFFKGIENFRYITLRSLFVKFLYVISVFLFVRKSEDYGIYFFLSCAVMVANAGFNWLYKNNFIRFSFKKISVKPYLKSVIILGVYAILTSMYTTFNTAYLGFVCGNAEVGYYSTAMKLQSIILAVYTAFTGVMIPRMSSMIEHNQKEDIQRLIYRSFDALYVFAIPLVVFTMIYAPQIIRIVSGPGYEAAITPMRIVMPLILIIGIEQILVLQILMPFKEDKVILINSIVGAFVGVCGNIILVPLLKSEGSAMVSLISEVSVLLSANIYVNKVFGKTLYAKCLFKQSLIAVPILLILIFVSNRFSMVSSVLLGGIALILYWAFVQYYVTKDEIVTSLLDKLGSCRK